MAVGQADDVGAGRAFGAGADGRGAEVAQVAAGRAVAAARERWASQPTRGGEALLPLDVTGVTGMMSGLWRLLRRL
ncbi:hypothetical protein FJY71_08605 [candidate division WOR-3 bacterium]|nr:hypothetical protein [candidate division WOR-3 bacterium]